MINKSQISKEIINRINIWHIVARQSYEFMLASEYFWQLLVQDKNNIYSQKYIINNTERHFNIIFSALEGLHTAAIILFWQIFDEGKGDSGGPGISNNKNKYLKNLRKELDDCLIKQLNWDENKYKSFKNKIKNIRHKLVAHYDGSFANYQEVPLKSGSVSTMKPPGGYLNRDEAKEFLSITKLTYEFIEQKLKILQSSNI
jgi:hypothetical protein